MLSKANCTSRWNLSLTIRYWSQSCLSNGYREGGKGLVKVKAGRPRGKVIGTSFGDADKILQIDILEGKR